MLLSTGFEIASNIMQFALPGFAWVSDIAPDIKLRNLESAFKKTLIIGVLIIVQNRSGKYLKMYSNKRRPNGSDFESFPSGHMMIAAQSTVRLIYKYGLFSKEGAFGIVGSTVIALGRYLPGQHDIIDLTAGAFLGSFLGAAWNRFVPTI